MADAFSVSEIDGLANVEAKAIGWNETRSKFAGVEADMDFGIHAVQVVEHEHLPMVFGHGDVAIFRHDEVETDDARILRCHFEGEEGLSEDLLRRKAAKNLIEETDFDGACHSGAGLTAVFNAIARVELVIEFLALDSGLVANPGGEQDIAEVAEILACRTCSVASAVLRGVDRSGGPFEVRGQLNNTGVVRGLHDFEILLVLSRGAGSDFVEPFSCVRFAGDVEAGERGEELVVSTDTGAGDEAAHGEGVDESVVELLILEGIVGALVAFAADGLGREASSGGLGFKEAHGFGIDAEAVGCAILDEGFGVDCAGEMHVKISPLGHAGEEGIQFEWTLFGVIEGSDGMALACGQGRGGDLCWVVRRRGRGRLSHGGDGATDGERCGGEASSAGEHERP